MFNLDISERLDEERSCFYDLVSYYEAVKKYNAQTDRQTKNLIEELHSVEITSKGWVLNKC